jgi:hypothetical protein
MIMGLSISFFALMMVAVIGSLLIIIFSFSFSFIVGLLLFNVLLYGALVQWVRKPFHYKMRSILPKSISLKQLNFLDYV